MCFGSSGGLGKIFAPLAGTGLDPVGRATNKALGLDEDKKRRAAAAATPAPTLMTSQQTGPLNG